jgi:hypothetical protein
MIALIITLALAWLLWRWLRPRPAELEALAEMLRPPQPQIVIHLHQPRIVLTLVTNGEPQRTR